MSIPTDTSNHLPKPNEKRRKASAFPNSRPIAPDSPELATLARQLGQTKPGDAALGVPCSCACAHGFPQAFALDPVPPAAGGELQRANSGLLKLTCPHLVRAVDALEDDGFIHEFNSRLGARADWQESVAEAHGVHATVRRELVEGSESDMAILRGKLGDRGADAFLRCGVAELSPESLDVKCLHAWLADWMFRGGDCDVGSDSATPLGDAIVEIMRERGVGVAGAGWCATQLHLLQRQCRLSHATSSG